MDVNDDGVLDILSGSYSRHDPDMAGLFQVLLGTGGGAFSRAATLNGTDGEPLIIAHEGEDDVVQAICTRPFAVDWDGDGDLDLVAGNFAGGFHLFRGEGGGRFAPGSEPVRTRGRALSVPGHHGDPFCIDWDGDGDLDLLSGSSQGGVYWACNVRDEAGEPELRPFVELIAPGPQHEYGAFLAESQLRGPTTDARIWVADVDGDGKLDVLVGDAVTLVGPAAGLTREQCVARREAWDEKMEELRESRDSDAIRAHYERRAEFIDERRTGFVWLYRQR